MAEEEIRARLKLRGRAEVQAELRRLQREIDRTGTAAMRSSRQANTFGSSWGFVGSMVTSAAHTIKYAAIGIVGAVTSIGVAAAGMGIQAYMGYEQAEIAFTNLLKSGPKATQMLKDLQYLADHSPFELPGLLRGSQKLMAFGFAGEDILPVMRRIGDAAAGLAVGEEGISRITLALGQMRTAGRTNAMDIRQLSEVGIDVWSELAKQAGVTIPKVRKMVTEGRITSEMGLRASFAAMDKFKGMTEMQAKTMGGLWSTIKDGARTATRLGIEPFAEGIKGVLRGGVRLLEQMPNRLKSVSASAKTMGNSIIAGFREGGLRGAVEQIGIMSNKGTVLMQVYDFVADAFQKVIRIIVHLATFVRQSLIPAFAGIVVAIDTVLNPLGVLRATLGFMARNSEIMIPLMWALATVWGVWKAITLANTVATRLQNMQEQIRLLNQRRQWVALKLQIAQEKIMLGVRKLHVTWITRTTVAERLRTAATKAGTVATKAAAAATWLLNAAMTANPIMLAVAAAALLAVGLYTLYRRSEGFRNIVQGTFGWIKKNWPLLLAILTGPIGLAVLVITKHWDKIKAGFKTVINWIIDRWNGLEFKVPGFDPPGPGPKFAGFTLGVPDIPKLHAGGTLTLGGAVNMKPREEIVYLPKAASVVPLKSDLRPLSETGGSVYSGPERVVLEVDGKVLTEVVLGGVRKKVARQ